MGKVHFKSSNGDDRERRLDRIRKLLEDLRLPCSVAKAETSKPTNSPAAKQGNALFDELDHLAMSFQLHRSCKKRSSTCVWNANRRNRRTYSTTNT